MKNKILIRREKGFTLIELLVVIGILAVLMGIVLIAINPARQFAQANNSTRTSNVKEILEAIGQFTAENKGVLPTQITTTAQNIKSGVGGADLCTTLMPTYISALPEDPSVNGGTQITACTSYDTGYTVIKDANNRITVAAPQAQLGQTISLTR